VIARKPNAESPDDKPRKVTVTPLTPTPDPDAFVAGLRLLVEGLERANKESDR
jgi:hypothetical protein